MRPITAGADSASGIGLSVPSWQRWRLLRCMPVSSLRHSGWAGPRCGILQSERIRARPPCNGSCSMTHPNLRWPVLPRRTLRSWLQSVCQTACRRFQRLPPDLIHRSPKNPRSNPVSGKFLAAMSGRFKRGSSALGFGRGPRSAHRSSNARCRLIRTGRGRSAKSPCCSAMEMTAGGCRSCTQLRRHRRSQRHRTRPSSRAT